MTNLVIRCLLFYWCHYTLNLSKKKNITNKYYKWFWKWIQKI